MDRLCRAIRAAPLLFWTVLVLATTVTAVALRIGLVRSGIMYGATPVRQANVLTGVLVVLATVLVYRSALLLRGARRARPRPEAAAGAEPAGDGWGELAVRLATVATAIATGVAAVTAVVNVYAPEDPPGTHVPGCPGVRVWGADFVATTDGTDGNNTRRGPGQSYAPNGRLPAGCSVGFDGFCLGDPISDAEASTAGVATWVDSRWLRLAKHSGGGRHQLARMLSGERESPQFVAEALVSQQRPYGVLEPVTPATDPDEGGCDANRPEPEKVRLELREGRPPVFHAQSRHAPNIGLAVWSPPGEGFLDTGYQQIYTPGPAGTPEGNPGRTGAGGTKDVTWPYQETLLNNLDPGRQSGRVVVLAVPCLAANIPHFPAFAMATYQVSRDQSDQSGQSMPQLIGDVDAAQWEGLEVERLTRAACQPAH